MERTTNLSKAERKRIFDKFLRQYHPDKNQSSALETLIAHDVTVFLFQEKERYLNEAGAFGRREKYVDSDPVQTPIRPR